MGFPAHPDFIGRGDTTSTPKRYVKLGRCAFLVNLNILNQIEHCLSERSEEPSYFQNDSTV